MMFKRNDSDKSVHERTCDYLVKKAKENMRSAFGTTIEMVDMAQRKANQFNTLTAYDVLRRRNGL